MVCIPPIASSQQHHQAGQALVESLIAIAGLALLWIAIHWLANYQDMSLSATHASRHAAFIATRLGDTGEDPMLPESAATAVKERFFAGAAHRWVSLQGAPVLDRRTSLGVHWSRGRTLSDLAQPGLTTATSKVLREEWALEDAGVLQARVRIHPTYSYAQRAAGHGFMDLRGFPPTYPSLDRSTSILTGAGHSASDTKVQTKVGESELAWGAAHSNSQSAAADVLFRAKGVDAAWGRAKPTFDWLQRWEGSVPEHLLRNSTGD